MSHALYDIYIDAEKFPKFKDAKSRADGELAVRLIEEYHFLDGQDSAASEAFRNCREHPQVFNDQETALRFLEDQDYRYRAQACRYTEIEEYIPTKQETELSARQQRLIEEKHKYAEEHAIRNYKKTLKKHCTGCTADIPVRFFRNDDRCPLCGKDLRSDSVKKTLASYDERIKNAGEQAKEIKLKRIAKMKKHTYWLFIADIYLG